MVHFHNSLPCVPQEVLLFLLLIFPFFGPSSLCKASFSLTPIFTFQINYGTTFPPLWFSLFACLVQFFVPEKNPVMCVW